MHTASAILVCETPQETKQLVSTITNFNHQKWIQNGLELVRPGIKAKFYQNPLLMKTPQARKPKILVEKTTINSTWVLVSYLQIPWSWIKVSGKIMGG